MFRLKSMTVWIAALAFIFASAAPSLAMKWKDNHFSNDKQNQNQNKPPKRTDNRGNQNSQSNNSRRENQDRPNNVRPNNVSPNNQNQRNQNVPRPVPQPPTNQEQSQGHHAGQWLRQYKNLPPEQQKKALDNDTQFRNLKPEQQERLRNRLDRFNNLPPERQQRILKRMETWEHLTPQQKTQARQVFSQIKSLPPERRNAMQNAINSLRAMPPQARQRAIESGRFSQFSPQEREMLNGVSELPLAPAEAGQEGQPED